MFKHGQVRIVPIPLIVANLVSSPSPDCSPGVFAAGPSVSRALAAWTGLRRDGPVTSRITLWGALAMSVTVGAEALFGAVV
jgi:hypothetical protein